MIDASLLITDELCNRLTEAYRREYGLLKPEYPNIAVWSARMALSMIANSDALYHNVEHTANVTLCGLEIIHGKQVLDGGVAPSDWLHFVAGLLFHDIGYVRGLCELDGNDGPGSYATGVGQETVELGTGITDAALTPYHVDRGKWVVRNRFAGNPNLDAERITQLIERTRFPIPDDADHHGTHDYAGLLRGADLIGQLAMPNYLQRVPALFYEFEETGINRKLNCGNPGQLLRDYPKFFWSNAFPYLGDALRCLKATAEGRVWVNNLYSQVFAVEHELHER